MSEAVRVLDLTRRFGDFTAVDQVSFQVGQGEIFGFLGPNGAGKTTTIRIGRSILTEGEEIRQRIGYMSQKFSLYGDLTVGENIELFGGLYGVEGERFLERRDWALEMAGLADRVDHLTRGLPLGWKQRLALGCAILHQPPILFLDEPTSGVDPSARRRFWDLINELAEGGTTILVSTHYMEEAEYCNRLVLMNRGRVIALETPAGLRAQMDEPLLSLKTDDPPGTVEALKESPRVLEAAMFGREVHVVVEDEGEGRQEIQSVLEDRGIPLLGLERVMPSLEDVFVALIRREGGVVEG